MNTGSETDHLWRSFKDGDKKSFHIIYNDHFVHLSNYGLRLTNDRELLEDAIHDLFVKLWNNKSNLADVTSIRSYLLVALRSVILNKIRKSSRLKLYDDADSIPFNMDFSPESEFISREDDTDTIRRLTEGLNKLTIRQKEVLYLRYYAGLNYDEIATVLDISVKATYKLSGRALQALREIITIPVPLFVGIFSFFHHGHQS